MDLSKLQVNTAPAIIAFLALVGLIVLSAMGKVDAHEVLVFVGGVLLPAVSPASKKGDE